MLQSDLHGNVQSAAEMRAPGRDRRSFRVTAMNGPKVNNTLALVKLGYMLESLVYPGVRGTAA